MKIVFLSQFMFVCPTVPLCPRHQYITDKLSDDPPLHYHDTTGLTKNFNFNKRCSDGFKQNVMLTLGILPLNLSQCPLHCGRSKTLNKRIDD